MKKRHKNGLNCMMTFYRRLLYVLCYVFDCLVSCREILPETVVNATESENVVYFIVCNVVLRLQQNLCGILHLHERSA
jgi:hypothetical protein